MGRVVVTTNTVDPLDISSVVSDTALALDAFTRADIGTRKCAYIRQQFAGTRRFMVNWAYFLCCQFNSKEVMLAKQQE